MNIDVNTVKNLYNINTNKCYIMRAKDRRRLISISQENYLTLKKLGSAGDSFNDVITDMLKNTDIPQTDLRVGRSAGQLAVDTKTSLEKGLVHE